MGMLEHLLRSLNSDIVNTIFLFSMLIIFALGIGLARKGTQVDFVNYVPTLLTTAGIFGTFLGIVMGLLDFNQNNIEASIPPPSGRPKDCLHNQLSGHSFLTCLQDLINVFLSQAKTGRRKCYSCNPRGNSRSNASSGNRNNSAKRSDDR